MDSRLIYLAAAVMAVGVVGVGVFGVRTTVTVAPQPIVTQQAAAVIVEPTAAQTIRLEISGMTSSVDCVTAVRSALEEVDGVTKADVSMPNKAVVTLSKEVSPEDLEAAVKKAGDQYSGKVVADKG